MYVASRMFIANRLILIASDERVETRSVQQWMQERRGIALNTRWR